MSQPDPSAVPEITASELKDRMDAAESLVLVDVREHFERAISDLPDVGQLRIPMGEVPNQLHRIPQDAPVVVYCRSGARSGSAVRYLRSRGFDDVMNLKGGVLAWREDVDPSIAAY